MKTFRNIAGVFTVGRGRHALGDWVRSSFHRCPSVPMCAGLLLLGPAALKLHQLVTEPFLSFVGGVGSRPVALAVTAIETFLGCMLHASWLVSARRGLGGRLWRFFAALLPCRFSGRETVPPRADASAT